MPYIKNTNKNVLSTLLRRAEEGDASAQCNLGVMYGSGHGVSQDYAEAANWFQLAAEQGNASAQCNLGVMYRNGHGVKQDYAEAANWFRLAAEQGIAPAQFNLGVMYCEGVGVLQNHVEAYKWLSLAVSHATADRQSKYSDVRKEVELKMAPQQIAEAKRSARDWKPLNAARHRQRDRAISKDRTLSAKSAAASGALQ